MSGGGGASVDEAILSAGQMKSDLAAGLDVVDLNQTILFTLYRRVVLPLDGFVFWVRDDQLSASALPNRMLVNSSPLNQPPLVTTPAATFEAQGSLHLSTSTKQEEDEVFGLSRIVFTSKNQINDLQQIAPETMYLATYNGTRFAFSARSSYYRQAGLHHYTGDAVYPALSTQIIDSFVDLRQGDVIVSNSLPIWLKLGSIFPIYPSFLLPDNFTPPYAVVHIGDDSPTPLQSGPFYDSKLTRLQLVKDVVRITTYGVRNDQILEFIDLVTAYTLANPTVMGVMNSPVPRDVKRMQAETLTIAQKKTITFEVDYYQTRVRDEARQLIKTVFINEFFATVVEVKDPVVVSNSGEIDADCSNTDGGII